MGTSIVLSDVVFSNKNLPVISELVNDGLVAAFRPTLSKDSLIDISGNGTPVTLIGSPLFEDGYISGYYGNGFRIEAAETESCTLIVVARAGYSVSRASEVALPLASRWDTSGNQRGVSTYFGLGGIHYYPFYQAYLKDAESGNMVSKYAGSTGALLLKRNSETDETMTPFTFFAITFNAATNEIIQYTPLYDSEFKTVNAGASLSGRRITNQANGQINRFEVCTGAGYTAAKGVCHVAEALVYNKALSRKQILDQYKLSQKFFEKTRAIAI